MVFWDVEANYRPRKSIITKHPQIALRWSTHYSTLFSGDTQVWYVVSLSQILYYACFFFVVAFKQTSLNFIIIIIITMKGTVRGWGVGSSASSYSEKCTFKSHKDMCTSLVLIPNTPLLASASLDATILIWDISSGGMSCWRIYMLYLCNIYSNLFHMENRAATRVNWSRERSL
jgi:WD40 repeat protein